MITSKAKCITLDVVPEVTTSILDHVSFFNTENKTDCCKVKAGKDNIGNLQLELPEIGLFSIHSLHFRKRNGTSILF
jgi:hypothetical protein